MLPTLHTEQDALMASLSVALSWLPMALASSAGKATANTLESKHYRRSIQL